MNYALRHLVATALTCAALGGTAHGSTCEAETGREIARLSGTLTAGKTYTAPVGPGWTFVLDPDPHGWVIRLRAPDSDDLARITPPFHFVPNPRDLHGWHFRNRANTGPNMGDVNAPQETRDFIFDREIRPDWPDATRVERAEGRGTLVITEFALSPPEPGTRAHFARLVFEACLSWPAAWSE